MGLTDTKAGTRAMMGARRMCGISNNADTAIVVNRGRELGHVKQGPFGKLRGKKLYEAEHERVPALERCNDFFPPTLCYHDRVVRPRVRFGQEHGDVEGSVVSDRIMSYMRARTDVVVEIVRFPCPEGLYGLCH